MGKISWRGSRLVSATIARMAGEVRRRRGRVLTAFTPLEKVLAEMRVSKLEICNLPTLSCLGAKEFPQSLRRVPGRR
jgi:hypothetical protein